MKNRNILTKNLTQYRRDLHQIPEIGFEEHKTKAYLLRTLKQWDCQIEEVAGTGLLAYFPAARPKIKGTVAFRCDMDGLPTQETNDVPYRSIHPGVAHACGHDGHMAMLLGLAGELDAMKETRPANVLLIFQPAEEGPGGATLIIKSGALSRYGVTALFALHLNPSKQPGTLMTRPGPFMARSSELDITIQGKSSHCSTPQRGIDALKIGCQLVLDLYDREQKALPKEELRLLKFGRMESGIVRNAISDITALAGTLRSFSDESFDLLIHEIHDAKTKFEEREGCTILISQSDGYPFTQNDPDLYELVTRALTEFSFSTMKRPSMAADDFAFYTKEVPSLYLFLGTGKKTPLHSSAFDFDESILTTGVEAYLALLAAVTT